MEKNITNWIEEEQKETQANAFTGEKLPSLKLESGKITEIEIDFSKKFEKYVFTNQKGIQITKAIIPVKHKGENKIFWLNIRNPLYKQVLNAGKEGRNKLKILQVGSMEQTKYELVEEEK